MNIKPLYAVLAVIGLLLLAIGATLLFTQQAPDLAPAPDIARYTADQVIAVARAYAGDECGLTKWQQERYPKARWTTEYLGNGKWKVTKDCSPYAAKSSWTFYESTGKLVKR